MRIGLRCFILCFVSFTDFSAGIANDDDNCKLVANKDQSDTDKDTVGDLCDNCPDKANDKQVTQCGWSLCDQVIKCMWSVWPGNTTLRACNVF